MDLWQLADRIWEWARALFVSVVCGGICLLALLAFAMQWDATATPSLAACAHWRGTLQDFEVVDRGKGTHYLRVSLRAAARAPTAARPSDDPAPALLSFRVAHEAPGQLVEGLQRAPEQLQVWLPAHRLPWQDERDELYAVQFVAGSRVLLSQAQTQTRDQLDRKLLGWVMLFGVPMALAALIPVVQTWRNFRWR